MSTMIMSQNIKKRADLLRVRRISSNTRRRRGYNWEDTISKRFNALEKWNAYRLGSSSTSLPDVLALSSSKKSAFIIEAKSGSGDRLMVPPNQIERCVDWYHTLKPFGNRHIVFAFKFISKKRVGLNKYDKRELREYYKEWNVSKIPLECICMYDGSMYARSKQKRIKMNLPNCILPTHDK